MLQCYNVTKSQDSGFLQFFMVQEGYSGVYANLCKGFGKTLRKKFAALCQKAKLRMLYR